MRRRLARPGLSYFDANLGRLVTEGPDVVDIKSRIRERWPNLNTYYDTVDRVWCITQTCEDGTERLFMLRPVLSEQTLMDIAKADPTNRNFQDPLKAIDDHNAHVDRERDRELEEIAGDFGERLIHALKQDGFYDHENIYKVKPKPHMRRRAINAGVRSESGA